jgi:endonuclease/exonuclease/phosphatase family metal-dependent hydrolase
MLNDTITQIEIEDDLIVMGDFNGKPGKRNNENSEFLGPFGERTSETNENGKRLL